MKQNELFAYLAGIIDGEAYIGIKKCTWRKRNRPDVKSPTYHERVQIKMTNPRVLQLLKDKFGGSLYKEKRIYQSKDGFKTNKIMYVYSATDRIAATIIKSTIPFLIEKKAQAENILKLRISKESKEAKQRGGKTQKRIMKKEILDFRESLYQKIKNIHNIHQFILPL